MIITLIKVYTKSYVKRHSLSKENEGELDGKCNVCVGSYNRNRVSIGRDGTKL